MIKLFTNTDAETTSENITLQRAFKILSMHMKIAEAGGCKCTALTNGGYSFEYSNLPFAKSLFVVISEGGDE